MWECVSQPVEVWIEFFRNLSTEEKTELMRGMWDALDELEKNIVLNDVRAFIAQVSLQHPAILVLLHLPHTRLSTRLSLRSLVATKRNKSQASKNPRKSRLDQ